MLNNELHGLEGLASGLLSGSFNYDEFTASIDAAVQIIPAAWEKALFSELPTDSLLRYFHFHLEGIRKISDTLYVSPAAVCANPAGADVHRFFQTRLLALIDHLEDSFESYFDDKEQVPYAFHDRFIANSLENFVQFQSILESSNVPGMLKKCLLDYIGILMNTKNRSRFTFAALAYGRSVLKGILTAITQRGENNIAHVIADVLTRVNFNHLGFLAYKVQSVSTTLSLLPLPGRLKVLQALTEELKWAPAGQTGYDSAWPSLNTMLKGWLAEEISLIETARSSQAQQNVTLKLPLNLSVAHLACLLRLFYEENLIPNTSLTDIFKFSSRNYQSKRQDHISAASLSKEFYAISQVTAAVTKDMLQKMIARINRNYFPVWAVAYPIIHALLKIR